MILLALDYLEKTIPKLPDFNAVRNTVHYRETPEYQEMNTNLIFQPLHVVDESKETVLYRGSREITDSGTGKHKKEKGENPYLVTYGTFGPVLDGVRDEIAAGVTWSRWERGSARPRAVFRFQIPAELSRYQVWACCFPDGDGKSAYQKFVGHHGEITIDPSTGAVLRLEWRADLKSSTLLDRSDIMIEYGPVEIGGKMCICPIRSVSIMRARSIRTLREWDESFMTYGPYATALNDIAYSHYHMFGSESTVLSGFTPVPEEK